MLQIDSDRVVVLIPILSLFAWIPPIQT